MKGHPRICSSKYLFFTQIFDGWEMLCKNICVLGGNVLLGNRQFRVSWVDFAPRIAGMCYFSEVPPPLWKGWISPLDHAQFPIGCRCTLLAGSEERIQVSEQCPKMLKMAFVVVVVFVLKFRSFSQNFALGAPVTQKFFTFYEFTVTKKNHLKLASRQKKNSWREEQKEMSTTRAIPRWLWASF